MFSALRKLLNLALVLLLVNALYQFVPTYVHYVQFKDAVKETAIFSRGISDGVIAEKILSLAAEHDVPLDRESITIQHDRNRVFIDASYVKVIAFVPTWKYPWAFEVRTEALQLSPNKPEH